MNRLSDIPEDILQWAADFWDAHLETEQVEMVARAYMAGQAAPLPPATGLTHEQAKVLTFVRDFQAQHDGVSPTYDEIGAGTGRSKSNVHYLLRRLAERGVVRFATRARSITIVGRA